MIAKQKAHNARQAASTATAISAAEDDYWSSHPGLAESMVPVWGSAREAIADYREGDIVGAAVDGAMAVGDLTGEGYVLKSLGKGGLKVVGSHTWNATRKMMGKKGLLEAGEHGHHWAVPRNGWGKVAPDAIKNQPWNIKGRVPETHGRIHGPYAGKPQFNVIERYIEGTPTWWKVQNGIWLGHGVQGAQEGLNPSARDDR
jgi:hypothetical protein